MALLPDLVGRIRLDMSELNRAEGEARSRGAAIGTALGTAVGSLAGGLLAAAGERVLQFVSGSIDAFAKLEDATSVTKIKFGEAAGSVEDFASRSATAFGLSKRESLEAANTFGTFGKAVGLTGQPLADFSTQMTGLAGDMASFSGTTPDEAVTALGAAFRGEYDPIERFGVLINKEIVNQKALEMGLASTKDEITKGDEVLATRQLILEQTGAAQGDFARTSDSVANSQKRMAAETENAQAALGEKLAPAFLVVLNALNQVINGITTFLGFIGQVVQWCREWWDVLAAVGAVLLVLTARIIAFNVAMAVALTWNSVIAILRGITTAFWALNAAMIANPIGAVIALVAALVAGVIIAYNHSETFRNAVDALGAAFNGLITNVLPQVIAWVEKLSASFMQAVTDVDDFGNNANAAIDRFVQKTGSSFMQAVRDVDDFGNNVNALPGKLGAALGPLADRVWQWITVGWQRAKDGANAAIGLLINTVTAIPGQINTALGGVPGKVLEFIKGGWDRAVTAVQQANQRLFGYIREIPTMIVNTLTSLPGQLYTIGQNIITGLLNGLKSLGPQIVSYLTNLIPEPVRKALNISSPSGVFREIGRNIMQGLQVGLDDLLPQLQAKMNQITSMIKQSGTVLAEDGSKVAAGFYDSIRIAGKTFTKGQAGWAEAAKRIGLTDAQINASMGGVSGSATIAGQRVSGSISSTGQATVSGFGQTYNIDARSFGTQFNPKDVVDQILWKAKAGGLVPA